MSLSVEIVLDNQVVLRVCNFNRLLQVSVLKSRFKPQKLLIILWNHKLVVLLRPLVLRKLGKVLEQELVALEGKVTRTRRVAY